MGYDWTRVSCMSEEDQAKKLDILRTKTTDDIIVEKISYRLNDPERPPQPTFTNYRLVLQMGDDMLHELEALGWTVYRIFQPNYL